MLLYMDLDGVLADLDAAVTRILGPCPNPEKGMWGYEHRYGSTYTEIWNKLTSVPDFWYSLSRTAEFPALLQIMLRYNTYVVTTPIRNSPQAHAECAYQKVLWVEMNLPNIPVMLVEHKHLLARRDAVLVDDRERSIYRFHANGGHAFLVPRNWNNGNESRDWVSELRSFIPRCVCSTVPLIQS